MVRDPTGNRPITVIGLARSFFLQWDADQAYRNSGGKRSLVIWHPTTFFHERKKKLELYVYV